MPRLLVVDLARTAALLGMILFHLVRDLEIFGLAAPGTTLSGGWAVFARSVAGSFLFLSGVSLVLAQQGHRRWRNFARRLVVLAGAAAAISLATFLAVPGQYVFFGILHAIAVSSVLALPFLRLPVWMSLGGALLIVLADQALTAPPFDAVWMKWTGLSSAPRPSLDFIPLVPWFAPVLLGVFSARTVAGLQLRPVVPSVSRWQWQWLAWPGRHSLMIYLLHQPVLLGALWLITRFLP
ncbi:heparan-alpha-glucosaminide N-acetyltransferase [Puniceibacterium confluentis]|uniref:heparan-alpha-glucosaminide N-acetyltransferase n=1 Tax=Puniceibacterium confluentis TaxID=1958944 RepID=UPI0011B64AD7|nr:heparan-alpha-glucosaminide N-acetyltransferase [Puniceibacterium confluentis]